MRRAPLVFAGTAAGVAGVLLFQPRSPSLPLGSIPSATGAASGTASGAPAGSSGKPAASGSATGSSAAGSTSSTGSTGSSSGGSPSSGNSASSGGTATSTTYTGTVVTYNYGVLSVRITVSGHSITKVGIASLTDGGNFRSESIDQQSIPILERETISAQSADIQSVSGASYTSAGFARSLQSALGKARL